MFNYELVVKDEKGNVKHSYQLEVGESKKGTYKTLAGKAANKALPFGKMYVDEDKLGEAKKAKK